tara:strand:- start:1383 stop:2156 length:774 start_codon:yes stop_codon:yes gene_type:complete
MLKKVFVQQNSQGEWLTRDCYTVAREFTRQGLDVIPFHSNDFDSSSSLPIDKESMVYGEVHLARKGIKAMGYRPPDPLTFPPCLLRSRDIPPTLMTMEQLRTRFKGQDPGTWWLRSFEPKDFPSQKVESFSDLVGLDYVSGSSQVWISPIVSYISEYKLFMESSCLVGVAHVKGDPLITLDLKDLNLALTRAKQMVQDSYVLHMGVAMFPNRPESIRTPTLFIKAQEVYGTESLNLSPSMYCTLLQKRWNQLGKITR